MDRTTPLVVFLAFANDRAEDGRYLRNLPEELRRVRSAMAAAVQGGLCEIVERANATLAEVLDVFLDARYRDRIAIFHFGGHAGSDSLLFESPAGAATAAHAEGLAKLLAEQRGIELVFLNGCSSLGHVQGLLEAGVSAVIATSQSIEDSVATELAARFYQSLASGASIRTAFAETKAAIQASRRGLSQRKMTLHVQTVGPPLPFEHTGPWALIVAPGAEERVRRWTLPVAAHDPSFGLPPLPAFDLPASPFKHLDSFTRGDAPVFFGRGREIRELFEAVTAPDGDPIVLLFGASGVGKSSLLAAGLQPRLEASHGVLYLRRVKALGLTHTLARALTDDPSSSPGQTDLRAPWRLREESDKPLVIILDQVEEAWTRPSASACEIEEFAEHLRSLFALREGRPRGRLVLGFRKEWLAEVLGLLSAGGLPCTRVELGHPDRAGIAEAVAGVASTDRLRRRYLLEVDPELPRVIADDLLADRGSSIAPVLQILLTKMWDQATRASLLSPRFTIELYQRMKRQGILLADFMEEQLAELREWRPAIVDSGLILDLLAHHTTPLGTAEARPMKEVVERYDAGQDIAEILERCRDRHLLTIGNPILGGESEQKEDLRTIRLAHDTLTPLVRRRFESSDLPGQRALRILEQRGREWEGGKVGPPLDEFDLAVVAAGQLGMRARTADEERLVAASSRQAGLRRRRRALQLTAAVAVALILGIAVWALRQRKEAVLSAERSRDRADAALADSLIVSQPTEAALVLLEIEQADSTPAATINLSRVMGDSLEFATLNGHTDEVRASSFSPDGTSVVTASLDGTARIWNAKTGQPIATLTGHTSTVRAASFSPDSTRVVTASGDHTARIWNAKTGQPITTLIGHTAPVRAASLSPDGMRVVTASVDHTARIWNADNGHPIATLVGHTNWVLAASFSPDGLRVVTASEDHTARVWNADTGKLIAILAGHTGSVETASFNQDGTRVVTASEDHTARIWNASTGQSVAILEGHTEQVGAACFSPGGSRVATASLDSTARIWKASTGQLLATCRHSNWVRTASFSPDGTQVVTASSDHTAAIWDTATGRRIATLTGHKAPVWIASFSPDGRRVVTGSEDKTAQVWNAPIGRSLYARAENRFWDLASAFGSGRARGLWSRFGGGEHFQSLLRARTQLCLRAEFRQVALGESELEASIHEKACQACVPLFFSKVKGVQMGDSQYYLAAWREYRGCLHARSGE